MARAGEEIQVLSLQVGLNDIARIRVPGGTANSSLSPSQNAVLVCGEENEPARAGKRVVSEAGTKPGRGSGIGKAREEGDGLTEAG